MLIRADLLDILPTVQVLAIGMVHEGAILGQRQRVRIGKRWDGTKLPGADDMPQKRRNEENDSNHNKHASAPEERGGFGLPQARKPCARHYGRNQGDQQERQNGGHGAADFGFQMQLLGLNDILFRQLKACLLHLASCAREHYLPLTLAIRTARASSKRAALCGAAIGAYGGVKRALRDRMVLDTLAAQGPVLHSFAVISQYPPLL